MLFEVVVEVLVVLRWTGMDLCNRVEADGDVRVEEDEVIAVLRMLLCGSLGGIEESDSRGG